MNPFTSRINNQSWIVPVSFMSLILGFMVMLAWVTPQNRGSRFNQLGPEQRDRALAAVVDPDKLKQMDEEIRNLQADKTRLENVLAKRGDESKILNDNLQTIKAFAGLTAVEGPGILITLSDKPSAVAAGFDMAHPDEIIHDQDVLRVVNELWASGAEAVSVDGLRVSVTSSYRCVGTTILVNDVKVATPIEIRGLGDPKTLMGAMNMPGGELSKIRETDANMVKVEQIQRQRLEPFTGSTTFKHARVPEETPK